MTVSPPERGYGRAAAIASKGEPCPRQNPVAAMLPITDRCNDTVIVQIGSDIIERER